MMNLPLKYSRYNDIMIAGDTGQPLVHSGASGETDI